MLPEATVVPNLLTQWVLLLPIDAPIFDQPATPSQPDLCNRRLPQSRFVTQEASASTSRFMRND
jgi:hypothetical protein